MWHLADKGGLDLSNSADTKYALTNGGAVASADGKIGGGTNKFFPDHAAVSPGPADSTHWYLDNRDVSIGANGAVTISLWKKQLSADQFPENPYTPYDGNHMTFVFGVGHAAYNSFALFAPFYCSLQWYYSADDASKVLEDPLWCSPTSYSDRWVYVTAVYNPGANRLKALYLDGVLIGSTNGGATTNGTVKGFRLGQDPTGRGPDPSQFDEVRISNIARTPDWIKTEFNNQNNPGAFYTFGAEVLPH